MKETRVLRAATRFWRVIVLKEFFLLFLSENKSFGMKQKEKVYVCVILNKNTRFRWYLPLDARIWCNQGKKCLSSSINILSVILIWFTFYTHFEMICSVINTHTEIDNIYKFSTHKKTLWSFWEKYWEYHEMKRKIDNDLFILGIII